MISPDIAYHVTTIDRAEKCLTEGIIPGKTTMSSQRALELEGEWDSNRPKSIQNLGLSRLSSVFAHPELDDAGTRRNGGWLNRVSGGIAILAIQIQDSSNVYVGDGLLNSDPHTPTEYWASIVSLREYRARLVPEYRAPIRPERPLGHWRTYIYFWPEVLIPGVVKPDQVSLAQLDGREANSQIAAMY